MATKPAQQVAAAAAELIAAKSDLGAWLRLSRALSEAGCTEDARDSFRRLGEAASDLGHVALSVACACWLRGDGDTDAADALIDQIARFLVGRLAVDAARFGFAIVDLPRLLGEAIADIVTVAFDVLTQRHQSLAHLLRGIVAVGAATLGCHRRRHDRLRDLAVAAGRADNLLLLHLPLESLVAAKPAFELVPAGATEIKVNHRSANYL